MKVDRITHSGFGENGNSAIQSAVPENPTLGSNTKSTGRPVPEIRPFEIFQDGGQPPSWIWSNRRYVPSMRRPQKPYPRTKHEVDRMTRCRDMAVRNFTKCKVGQSVGGSVGRSSILYIVLIHSSPLR